MGQAIIRNFAVFLCLYLFAVFIFTGVLRSAHLLSADQLYLRLGTWFKCRLPHRLIAAVEQYSPSSYPKPDMLGVILAREGETLYCLSRKSDVIRILLTEPVMVKAPAAEDRKNKRGLVREMLINVDEPERFLQSMKRAVPVKEDAVPLQAEAAINTAHPAGSDEEALFNGDAYEAVRSESQNAALPPSLEFEKLTRYYGDFPAVQNLTLQTYPGEIFGFLGANGAGKTTTIRMITGLLRPTAGKVMVSGEDLWRPGTEARRLIGFVPDTPLVYERLTAREHMMVAGRLYGLPRERIEERTEELLSILGLEKWGNQIISAYSMGMKRKISLALALLTDPELIIVDELTNAFDAPTLAQIKDILLDLRHREKTVFLSTHVMDVAEKICDRVGIIHQGQLKALGTVDELCRAFAVDGGLEPLFLKITAGKGAGE
jgi:ABC-2 type transport system ATP-binding protein